MSSFSKLFYLAYYKKIKLYHPPLKQDEYEFDML